VNKKCANKLAFRWAILAFVVSELLLVSYWKFWQIPTAEALYYNGAVDKVVWQLPLVLSRFADPIIVAFVVFCVARLMFYRVSLYTWYSNRTIFTDESERKAEQARGVANSLDGCLAAGIFFGVFGSVVIAGLGIIALVICTFVCTLITLFVADESRHVPYQKIFIADVIACLVIWGLCTLYLGAIAGTLYALTALAISAVSYFGTYYTLRIGHAFFTGTFRRTMLGCDVDSADC